MDSMDVCALSIHNRFESSDCWVLMPGEVSPRRTDHMKWSPRELVYFYELGLIRLWGVFPVNTSGTPWLDEFGIVSE